MYLLLIFFRSSKQKYNQSKKLLIKPLKINSILIIIKFLIALIVSSPIKLLLMKMSWPVIDVIFIVKNKEPAHIAAISVGILCF
jgi:hypothetical protein